jgi:sugar porter (SP) family MFS transporter
MASSPSSASGSASGRRNGFLLTVSAVAALGGFLFGFDTGVVSGALLYVRDDFGGLSSFQQGAVVSGTLLGAMFGALAGGAAADRFGRRRTIFVVALAFVAGIVVIVIAQSPSVLIAGRFIVGLGVGGASMSVPLYISELAPADVRGRLVSTNQLMITSGIVCAYLVDYAFASAGEWRWMFGVGLIPAIILGAAILFMPESPRWLVARGRVDSARSVLARVHDEDALEDELRVVQESSERPGFRALLAPGLRVALMLGIGLAVLQQVTGINTVIYYAPTILNSTGISSSNSILASLAVGAINVVMTIVSMSVIDRVGRRPLLLASLAGMVASLTLLGLALQLSSLGSAVHWLTLLFLVTYVASFAIGLGPVFWLLIAEIYPLRVRGEAMSVAAAFNWLANFAVGLTFLLLIDAVGRPLTFWFYAAIGVLAIAFTFKLVPETKGRTLEEIEEDLPRRFGRRRPAGVASGAQRSLPSVDTRSTPGG